MKDGWEVKPLGEVCEIRSGGTPSKSKEEYWGGNVPWVSPKDMKLSVVSDSIDHITTKAVTEGAARLVPVGSLLVVVRSGILARTIPVARTAASVAVNQDIKALLPPATVQPEYLQYLLGSMEPSLLKSVTRGATVHRLETSVLQRLPIPIPPLAEQERIVRFLDEALDAIDSARRLTAATQEGSHRLFEAHLNQVFIEGARRWSNCQLQDVCQRITVGHVGSMASRYKQRGIPFLRSQNIRPFKVDLRNLVYIDEAFHLELTKSKLQPGDLAIVRTGYPGTAAVIPDNLPVANCSDLVIVRPNDQVLSEYLATFFNSQHGRVLIGGSLVGSAQRHFNVKAARHTVLPIPSISEQESLVELSTKLRILAAEEGGIQGRKTKALDGLRAALLYQVFTGQL